MTNKIPHFNSVPRYLPSSKHHVTLFKVPHSSKYQINSSKYHTTLFKLTPRHIPIAFQHFQITFIFTKIRLLFTLNYVIKILIFVLKCVQVNSNANELAFLNERHRSQMFDLQKKVFWYNMCSGEYQREEVI